MITPNKLRKYQISDWTAKNEITIYNKKTNTISQRIKLPQWLMDRINDKIHAEIFRAEQNLKKNLRILIGIK